MPPKPQDNRPLTPAERQQRQRQRRAERDIAVMKGLNAALAARTKREAQEIVAEVLAVLKGRKDG